jgi:hypothetical protein
MFCVGLAVLGWAVCDEGGLSPPVRARISADAITRRLDERADILNI